MAAVQHWHAIKRELWELGRDELELDQGTLPVHDLLTVVVSCGTNSALFRLMDGWSKTDQLIANLGEQQAGLIDLQRRHPRPGVPIEAPRDPMTNQATQAAARGGVTRRKMQGFEPMALEDWIAFRDKNRALGDAMELSRQNQPKIDAALKRAKEQKAAEDKLRQNSLLAG